MTKKCSTAVPENSNDDSDGNGSESDLDEEGDLIKVEGVRGRFMQVRSMNDKYGERPDKLETITLSQFATSYSKCQKRPKDISLTEGCSKECGNIIDHLTGKRLPLYIELRDTKEIYRLRKFSTVLRIHASSKKKGEEEYFAEMQLFSPWRPKDLEDWMDTETCIKKFNERRHTIAKVRKKVFPFAMNEIIEEVKAQEGLDHVADEITDMLDGQGIQDDLDALDEGSQGTTRPITDFSQWHDDINNATEHNGKSNDSKFRPLELQTHEQLLATTKLLVSEQMLVLQKVLDFAKTTVQCRHSQLARDAPHQMGLIVHGGGGKYFKTNLLHRLIFTTYHDFVFA